MCGIAGILHFEPRARVDPAILDRMTDCLAHRGPDGRGTLCEGPVGLGHRRLSIIDLAGGAQPMRSADGQVTLVFNGEIYNFHSLRAELETAGHRFRTDSDTEVLLELYRARGIDAVDRLRGMFAFAIWDAPRRTLHLARDRVGIKPLFYARSAHRLVFGSELKAVLAAGGGRTDLDLQALDDYLAHAFIRAPRTIYQGINKLLPGHRMSVRLKLGGAPPDVSIRPFWRVPAYTAPGRDVPTPSEAKQELLTRLEESVRLRLIADVPLGAFLSGGLDSSTVVWLMSRVASKRVRTFTVGFHEHDFDERAMARTVARHLGTDHQEELISPDAVTALPHVLSATDEPFGDPSAIPTWYVCRMARRHVTVCLSGDGGDELFAGYLRHPIIAREAERLEWIPTPLRQAASTLARVAVPRDHRWRSWIDRLPGDLEARYARYRAIFSRPLRQALLSPELRPAVDAEITARLFARIPPGTIPPGDPLSPLLASDFTLYLPDDVLTKVDRMSMAHGLECRVPLLDPEVVSYVNQLPTRYKLQGATSKWLLRELIAPEMPPELLSQPKQGFSVPVDTWLRGDLAPLLRDVVHGPLRDSRLFQTRLLERLLRAHAAGTPGLGWGLWQLLIFGLWHDHAARNHANPA